MRKVLLVLALALATSVPSLAQVYSVAAGFQYSNTNVKSTSNTGAPEGVRYGSIGDVYVRSDSPGGVYYKTSGTNTNTGWVIASMTYPGAGLALSTGSAWGTSVTNNSANWNTAYGWGNHAGLYSPVAGSSSIVTVGTITTGTWDAGAGTFAGNVLPKLTDTYTLGSPSKLWSQGYISQLNAVLFAKETVSLYGGWLVVAKNAGVFAAAVGSGDTTINFGTAMTNGQFVLVRAADTSGSIVAEYMQVGSLVSGTTYNVTRNLSGAGAKNWAMGVPFMVRGVSGDGWVEMQAYDSPRLSVWKQGSAYNNSVEQVRIGDLAGMPNSSSGIGAYIGDATNYLRYTGGVLDVGGKIAASQLVSTALSGSGVGLGMNGRVADGYSAIQFRSNDAGTAYGSIYASASWPLVLAATSNINETYLSLSANAVTVTNGAFMLGALYHGAALNTLALSANAYHFVHLATLDNNASARFVMKVGGQANEEMLDFTVQGTYYGATGVISAKHQTYTSRVTHIYSVGGDGAARQIWVRVYSHPTYPTTLYWRLAESWGSAPTIVNATGSPATAAVTLDLGADSTAYARGLFTTGTIQTTASFIGALTGNASTATSATSATTATALASNPTDCGSNTYATTIDASGNLGCASVTNASTTGTTSATASTLALRDGNGDSNFRNLGLANLYLSSMTGSGGNYMLTWYSGDNSVRYATIPTSFPGGGSPSSVSCGYGEAVKTLSTTADGIVTGASCGAPGPSPLLTSTVNRVLSLEQRVAELEALLSRRQQ